MAKDLSLTRSPWLGKIQLHASQAHALRRLYCPKQANPCFCSRFPWETSLGQYGTPNGTNLKRRGAPRTSLAPCQTQVNNCFKPDKSTVSVLAFFAWCCNLADEDRVLFEIGSGDRLRSAPSKPISLADLESQLSFLEHSYASGLISEESYFEVKGETLKKIAQFKRTGSVVPVEKNSAAIREQSDAQKMQPPQQVQPAQQQPQVQQPSFPPQTLQEVQQPAQQSPNQQPAQQQEQQPQNQQIQQPQLQQQQVPVQQYTQPEQQLPAQEQQAQPTNQQPVPQPIAPPQIQQAPAAPQYAQPATSQQSQLQQPQPATQQTFQQPQVSQTQPFQSPVQQPIAPQIQQQPVPQQIPQYSQPYYPIHVLPVYPIQPVSAQPFQQAPGLSQQPYAPQTQQAQQYSQVPQQTQQLPPVQNPQVQSVSPQEPKISEHELEDSAASLVKALHDVEGLLVFLEESYDNGTVSEKAYRELKAENSRKLKRIRNMLKHHGFYSDHFVAPQQQQTQFSSFSTGQPQFNLFSQQRQSEQEVPLSSDPFAPLEPDQDSSYKKISNQPQQETAPSLPGFAGTGTIPTGFKQPGQRNAPIARQAEGPSFADMMKRAEAKAAAPAAPEHAKKTRAHEIIKSLKLKKNQDAIQELRETAPAQTQQPGQAQQTAPQPTTSGAPPQTPQQTAMQPTQLTPEEKHLAELQARFEKRAEEILSQPAQQQQVQQQPDSQQIDLMQPSPQIQKPMQQPQSPQQQPVQQEPQNLQIQPSRSVSQPESAAQSAAQQLQFPQQQPAQQQESQPQQLPQPEAGPKQASAPNTNHAEQHPHHHAHQSKADAEQPEQTAAQNTQHPQSPQQQPVQQQEPHAEKPHHKHHLAQDADAANSSVSQPEQPAQPQQDVPQKLQSTRQPTPSQPPEPVASQEAATIHSEPFHTAPTNGFVPIALANQQENIVGAVQQPLQPVTAPQQRQSAAEEAASSQEAAGPQSTAPHTPSYMELGFLSKLFGGGMPSQSQGPVMDALKENAPQGEAPYRLEIELEKLKAKLDLLSESKNAGDERMGHVMENMGEVRSMVFQREATMKELEARLEQYTEMVKDLEPQKFLKELDKRDQSLQQSNMKIEKLEAKADDLAQRTNTTKQALDSIGSLSNIARVNQELGEKLSQIESRVAQAERVAEDVGRTYVDLNKRLEEFAIYSGRQDSLAESVKELGRTLDSVNSRFDDYLSKQDATELRKEFEQLHTTVAESSAKVVLGQQQRDWPEPVKELLRQKQDVEFLLQENEDDFSEKKIAPKDYELVKAANLRKLAELDTLLRVEYDQVKKGDFEKEMKAHVLSDDVLSLLMNSLRENKPTLQQMFQSPQIQAEHQPLQQPAPQISNQPQPTTQPVQQQVQQPVQQTQQLPTQVQQPVPEQQLPAQQEPQQETGSAQPANQQPVQNIQQEQPAQPQAQQQEQQPEQHPAQPIQAAQPQAQQPEQPAQPTNQQPVQTNEQQPPQNQEEQQSQQPALPQTQAQQEQQPPQALQQQPAQQQEPQPQTQQQIQQPQLQQQQVPAQQHAQPEQQPPAQQEHPPTQTAAQPPADQQQAQQPSQQALPSQPLQQPAQPQRQTPSLTIPGLAEQIKQAIQTARAQQSQPRTSQPVQQPANQFNPTQPPAQQTPQQNPAGQPFNPWQWVLPKKPL